MPDNSLVADKVLCPLCGSESVNPAELHGADGSLTGFRYSCGNVQCRNVWTVRHASSHVEPAPAPAPATFTPGPLDPPGHVGHKYVYSKQGALVCHTCNGARARAGVGSQFDKPMVSTKNGDSRTSIDLELSSPYLEMAKALAAAQKKPLADVVRRLLQRALDSDNVVPEAVPSAVTDNLEFPGVVIRACMSMYSEAAFQAMRTDVAGLQDYWHGYRVGMHNAIAVIAGALGYDTDFLDSKHE